MAEPHNFPQYRKYPNGKTFFKITGPRTFIQLDIIGQKYDLHEVEAKQFPEIQRIQDMLLAQDPHWELCNEDEYNQMLVHCQQELEPLH